MLPAAPDSRRSPADAYRVLVAVSGLAFSAFALSGLGSRTAGGSTFGSRGSSTCRHHRWSIT